MPSDLRDPQEQQQLAELLKVDPSTLSDWKLEPGFMDEVILLAKQRARASTVDVIHALRRSATSYGLTGASADRKLWLQYMENFAEKQQHELPPGSIIFTRPPDGGSKQANDKPQAPSG